MQLSCNNGNLTKWFFLKNQLKCWGYRTFQFSAGLELRMKKVKLKERPKRRGYPITRRSCCLQLGVCESSLFFWRCETANTNNGEGNWVNTISPFLLQLETCWDFYCVPLAALDNILCSRVLALENRLSSFRSNTCEISISVQNFLNILQMS